MVLRKFAFRAAALVLTAGALAAGPAAALQGPSAPRAPGQNAPAQTALPADAVARVNDEIITGDAYRAFVKAYIAQNYYHGMAPEKLPLIADEALDILITDRLLLQEARRRKLGGDPAAARKQFDALKARYSKNPESAEEFAKVSSDVERELRNDTRVEELRNLVRDVGQLPQASVKKYYDDHRDLFTTPAATDMSIILIGVPPHGVGEEWTKATATAAAIRAEIVAGASFEMLAREESSHASSQEGGRLGALHKGQLQEQVDTAIAAMPVGAVSEPIRVLEGVALFKVNGRSPEKLQPYNAVEERAGALLKREMQERCWTTFVEELRKSARIKKADSLVEYVRDF